MGKKALIVVFRSVAAIMFVLMSFIYLCLFNYLIKFQISDNSLIFRETS